MSHILVAEDNEAYRSILIKSLEQLHHTFKTCPDGKQALQALKKENFDAVITDFRMPYEDGVTVAVEAWKAGISQIYINTSSPDLARSALESAFKRKRKKEGLKHIIVIPKMTIWDMGTRLVMLLHSEDK